MSEFKTSREYIETEYGTQHLARIFELNDAESMFDVMDEFSKKNQKSLISMVKLLVDRLEENGLGNFSAVSRAKQLIQDATTL